MTADATMVRRRQLLWLILLSMLTQADAAVQDVRIGVLMFRGDSQTLQRWSPTAAHLTATIGDYRFQMLPMDIESLSRAVADHQLEFVLTSPGHYAALESRYGVTRIVTLKNQQSGAPLTRYGSVIFTRADRVDINSLEDLRNRSLATVSKLSFGGLQMTRWELLQKQIDPFTDMRLVITRFPQERVVNAVLSGQADVGTVRTGVLEEMATAGDIRFEDIKVLNVVKDDFPFIHSTELYPEWPLAKSSHTSEELAEHVAISLLTMAHDDPAAIAGHYAGWTIPLDYTPVHDLLRHLKAAPYEQTDEIAFTDLFDKYWPWMLIVVLGFITGSSLLIYTYHLNRRLQRSSAFLEDEIREHERAKYQLVSANARLQHLLTAAPAMIYSCEPKPAWPTTFISDNVSAQLGHTPADFISNPQFWLDHIHPDDRHQVQSSLAVLLRDGHHHREYRFRTRDGAYRWLHDEVRLVRDEHGAPMEVVGYWLDVTERIRALELARRHESELAHCLRLTTLGEMATALAHEINQPLAAVRNYVQGCLLRLRSGQLDNQQLLHALEEVVGQTERAAAVVRHVREFVGKEKPQRAEHDINMLVTEAVRLVMPEARSAHVAVHTQLRAQPALASVNSIQIQQVIINIAHNALEAMRTEPGEHALFITSHSDEHSLHISIRDTGPGVPVESVEAIFNAFYTTKSSGMGMGLSISRTIIESHGGRLWAERVYPHGMKLTFTLPLARSNL